MFSKYLYMIAILNSIVAHAMVYRDGQAYHFLNGGKSFCPTSIYDPAIERQMYAKKGPLPKLRSTNLMNAHVSMLAKSLLSISIALEARHVPTGPRNPTALARP
jgi:hypothetical protein